MKKTRLKRRANNTGNIYKAPGNRSNPYIARIRKGYKEDGRPDWLPIGSFSSKAEAEKALSKSGIKKVFDNINIKFSEVYEKWCIFYYVPELSKKSKTQYNTAYKHLAKIHNRKFIDLVTSDYMDIINELELGYSAKCKIKTFLHLMYTFAKSINLTDTDYSEAIKIRKPKGRKKQPTFSKERIKYLLEHDYIEWVDSVLIIIFTGYRPEELLLLEKDKINLNEWFIINGIKTEAGIDRIAPIHPYIYEYLKKRCENTDKYLFTHNGRKMSTKTYCNKYFKPLMKQFGMEDMLPKYARHTFGTLAGAAQVDPLAITQAMGHTNYTFTVERYTSEDVKFLNKEIAKIKIN